MLRQLVLRLTVMLDNFLYELGYVHNYIPNLSEGEEHPFLIIDHPIFVGCD